MEHLDIVSLEELVPESGGGDNKDTGMLERGYEDTEEDDETREDITVKGEEDMEDDNRRHDVIQLEAEGEYLEDMVTGITGFFKQFADVDVEK